MSESLFFRGVLIIAATLIVSRLVLVFLMYFY
jgi:hypothetical protein